MRYWECLETPKLADIICDQPIIERLPLLSISLNCCRKKHRVLLGGYLKMIVVNIVRTKPFAAVSFKCCSIHCHQREKQVNLSIVGHSSIFIQSANVITACKQRKQRLGETRVFCMSCTALDSISVPLCTARSK